MKKQLLLGLVGLLSVATMSAENGILATTSELFANDVTKQWKEELYKEEGKQPTHKLTEARCGMYCKEQRKKDGWRGMSNEFGHEVALKAGKLTCSCTYSGNARKK